MSKISIDRDLLVSFIMASETVLKQSVASYNNELKVQSHKALILLPDIKKIIDLEDNKPNDKKYKEQKMF